MGTIRTTNRLAVRRRTDRTTAVLTSFGMKHPGTNGPGDANHDGVVNFSDITCILTNWSTDCT